jgi:MATE family multidrug resistance protein
MGVLSVVNTYVGQNFGAKRYRRTGQYAWAGIYLSLLAAAAMSPLALLAPRIFSLFGDLEPKVLDYTIIYFRFMVLSVAITLTSRVMEQFFYGVQRPLIVLAGSAVGTGLNIFFNWLLIYGHWGLPALGLTGAAIGTVAAYTIQLGMLIAVFASPKMHATFFTRCWRCGRWKDIRDILRIGWPAGLDLANNVFCWFLFTSAIVSQFGTAAIAATTVTIRYMGLAFMPAVGIGMAATAMVGRSIGEGRKDLARKRLHQALAVTMAYMVICSLTFWLARYPLVEWFVRDDPVDPTMAQRIIDIGVKLMICAAILELFDGVGLVYNGALRGAGDTRWPMLVVLALTWSINIGAASLIAWLKPDWGALGPWIAATGFIILRGAALLWRFESGKWERIDLLGSGTDSIDIAEDPFTVA